MMDAYSFRSSHELMAMHGLLNAEGSAVWRGSESDYWGV